MQHSTIEIELGRPYVVFVQDGGEYSESDNMTVIKVTPPLDEDRDGEFGGTLIVRGNVQDRVGLMIVKWDGRSCDVGNLSDGWRVWEEVKTDNEAT